MELQDRIHMKVYGRRYGQDGTCVELAQHGDGRVGLWDCHRQAWRVVWGLGLNQAGFREALLDWESPNGGTLTDDGCALVANSAARRFASQCEALRCKRMEY